MGTEVIAQHALARFIASGGYDRHLRLLRRSHRARRDALVAALRRHVPGAAVTGVAAGLHAGVALAEPVDVAALQAACERRSVRVYDPRPDMLFLGYAGLSEPALDEGVRRLAAALAEARVARGAPAH